MKLYVVGIKHTVVNIGSLTVNVLFYCDLCRLDVCLNADPSAGVSLSFAEFPRSLRQSLNRTHLWAVRLHCKPISPTASFQGSVERLYDCCERGNTKTPTKRSPPLFSLCCCWLAWEVLERWRSGHCRCLCTSLHLLTRLLWSLFLLLNAHTSHTQLERMCLKA